MAKVDVFVCGKCNEVFYFVEEYNEHRMREKCKLIQMFGFILWKNAKFKSTRQQENKLLSCWNVYQLWCKLEQVEKDSWVTASKTLQEMNLITLKKGINFRSRVLHFADV